MRLRQPQTSGRNAVSSARPLETDDDGPNRPNSMLGRAPRVHRVDPRVGVGQYTMSCRHYANDHHDLCLPTPPHYYWYYYPWWRWSWPSKANDFYSSWVLADEARCSSWYVDGSSTLNTRTTALLVPPPLRRVFRPLHRDDSPPRLHTTEA